MPYRKMPSALVFNILEVGIFFLVLLGDELIVEKDLYNSSVYSVYRKQSLIKELKKND
jgi:hypothetical protein